ncbi:MAG: hypothetical protein QW633_02445, partial [Candidatus Aenigmatarchaeota archaeon]
MGWNEESKLSLIKAIVWDKTFSINNYANFTGDRSLYNGNYYSDKPPGTSFISSFIFYLLFSLYSSNQTQKETPVIPFSKVFNPENATIFTSFELTSLERLERIIVTFFMSTLPSAILVCMIYKLCRFYRLKYFFIYLISFSFGLGSLIFPYGTTIMGYIFATFLVFLSFLSILIKKNFRFVFLAGVLAGFSIVVDYFSFTVLIGLVVFVYLRSKNNLLYFLFGIFLGLLPLLLYNFTIFSNPLHFTLFEIDPNINPCSYKFSHPICERLFGGNIYETLSKFIKNSIENLPSLLLFPYRGLLFFSPFLLFSIAGFISLLKRDERLGIVIFLIFVLSIVVYAFYPYWWGGSSFGLRYSIHILPFLSLSLLFFIKDFWNSRYVKLIFFITLCLSIFHMFLGFSTAWEGILEIEYEGKIGVEVSWHDKPIVVKKELMPFLNPIYEYYFRSFLLNGFRSRMLEGLVMGEIPDIRDFRAIPIEEVKLFSLIPFGILVVKVRFLVISILVTIVILIWSRELFRAKNKNLMYILFSLILLLFISRIEIKYIVYNKEFYPLALNEAGRWFGNESKIFIFSEKDGYKLLNISLDTYIFNKTRSLDLIVNEKLINTFYGNSILEKVYLKKGENEIKLVSREGCDYPFKIERNSSDYRCLSFLVKNITLIEENKFPNDSIVFGSNWYDWETDNKSGEKFRFSSMNSTILLFYNNESEKPMILNFNVSSYFKERVVSFYLKDVLIDNFTVYPQISHASIGINLKKGLNTIKIKSSCDIPNVLEGKDDRRCLSIAIKNLTLEQPKEIN